MAILLARGVGIGDGPGWTLLAEVDKDGWATVVELTNLQHTKSVTVALTIGDWSKRLTAGPGELQRLDLPRPALVGEPPPGMVVPWHDRLGHQVSE